MDLSLLIGDYSLLQIGAFLVGSIVFAAIAVFTTERFGPYATMAIVTIAVLAAAIDASQVWRSELPSIHTNNPDVTRFADWINHAKLSAAAYLIPTVVVGALALVLRRVRTSIASKIAVASVAAMVGIALGFSVRGILFGMTYPDPN